jgi:hypothetical protein
MWLIDSLADALGPAGGRPPRDRRGVYGSDLALRVLSDTPCRAMGGGPDPPEPSPAGWVALGLTWLLLLPLRWSLAPSGRRPAASIGCSREEDPPQDRPGRTSDLPRSGCRSLGRERQWGWVCDDLAEVDPPRGRGAT